VREPKGKTAIIFGGSGFLGSHLIVHLKNSGRYEQIINVDIVSPEVKEAGIDFVHGDVRQSLDGTGLEQRTAGDEVVIYNLAAICRIPGHPDNDYFETNIKGAENICALATGIQCNTIVFTSTMAVYGPSEEPKYETSLLTPDNPYGISKAIAEGIHATWQAASPRRNLHILRPGIIFGEREGANFTRLYKAINGGYFFYPGRKDTLKACIYVKDAARLCWYVGDALDGLTLYNAVLPEPPTIKEICTEIAAIIGRRPPRLKVPSWLLLLSARVITALGAMIGKKSAGIHPDRVRKLMLSTNVVGTKLRDNDFSLEYSLRDALVDWHQATGGKGLI